MRGETLDTRPLADPVEHPPERLLAGRLLRVLPPADALVLRYELLDLGREHVIVEFWLQFPHRGAQLLNHVRGEWEIRPVLALPEYADATLDHVKVCPPQTQDFRTPQTGAL